MDPAAHRRSWRGLAAPVGVAVTGAVAATVLHFRDPHDAGSYGICPVYALTGWWCPACGGLRAVNDLTNLDFAGAASSNILIIPFVAMVAVIWVRWVYHRWQGSPDSPIGLRPTATFAVLGLLVAFTVVRNTQWGSWLAPA
ncbi:DUF2752 domain-containing protein [Rhodococcus sp. 27YEA15]|uniref:DUF2752 domain-containing protein n=1 Tax=Rhodococcus sp. 27YEA15 TaxID=3156259 RepID=UPI003C7E06FA